jgi:hypothetical protein
MAILASSIYVQYVAPPTVVFDAFSQQQTCEDGLREIPLFWIDPTLVLTQNGLLPNPGWSSFK